MGCGKARFGRKGQKTPKIENVGLKICSLGPRGDLRVASRSHVQVASRSQGTNFETKIFNFRCFLALPTETSFTTPHYYPKYEVWALEIFSW